MSPFWPPNMDSLTRDTRMAEYLKSIYPIWAPFLKSDKYQHLAEWQAVHAADIKIFESNLKPDRSFATTKDAFRKAGGEKFSRIMGGQGVYE